MATTILRPTAWGRSFGLAAREIWVPAPPVRSDVFFQNFQFIGMNPFLVVLDGQYAATLHAHPVLPWHQTTKIHTNLLKIRIGRLSIFT
jgi:hypothetical protein